MSIKDHAKGSKEKGRIIRNKAVAWTYRWGVVSDKSLQYLHNCRPRLAYDLSRAGYLKKHAVPSGRFCKDGRSVYTLSPDGLALAQEILQEPILDIQSPCLNFSSWTTLQHTLNLQKMLALLISRNLQKSKRFSSLDDAIFSEDIRTETETSSIYRGRFTDRLIPDCEIFETNHTIRIEYDNSPKKNKELIYWCQQISRAISEAKKEGHFLLFMIFVNTDYQRKKYEDAFNLDWSTVLWRDQNRKLIALDDAPNINIRESTTGYVKVNTFNFND